MFYLCSITATKIPEVFGNSGTPFQDPQPPKYPDLHTVVLGQRPDCSGYLMLVDQVHPEFTLHTGVPAGYDFIFRQEWGLAITEEIIHRVIDTLRAEAYPPMADYLDAIVKGDTQQADEYIAKCLAVKQKYPKFSW